MTINLRSYLNVLFELHPQIKTPTALAKATKTSAQTVSNWQTRNTQNAENLSLIAGEMGIDVAWFKLPLNEFRQNLAVRFADTTALAARAKESEFIGLRIWDVDGSNRLIGNAAANQFGLVPESKMRILQIRQRTRLQLEIDLAEIQRQLRITAHEVWVFSEDKTQTVCLRPSPLAKNAIPTTRVLSVPDNKPDPGNSHPLAGEKLYTENLGTTSLVVALLPVSVAANEPVTEMHYRLIELACEPCPATLINRLTSVPGMHWLKRSFDVV
jgi:hypothetical protein